MTVRESLLQEPSRDPSEGARDTAWHVHLGRSWVGHPLEDDCPCGKAACGLVDSDRISADCPQHAMGAAKTIRQVHDAVACPAPHEPDHMGVWSDEGEPIWLPRSRYERRIDAIKWAMEEWHVSLPEVRCRARWMRYAPHIARAADGSVAWLEDLWHECPKDAPGAFRVWRLESA